MSDDLGSFEPHLPCRCVDCAVNHGDQADPEHDELIALRTENLDLKAERECLLVSRKYWPFSAREAVRRRDIEACRIAGEKRDQFVADLQEELDQLRAENNRLKDALADQERSHRAVLDMMDVEIVGAMDDFKRSKVELDSQATLAAVYLRERDALSVALKASIAEVDRFRLELSNGFDSAMNDVALEIDRFRLDDAKAVRADEREACLALCTLASNNSYEGFNDWRNACEMIDSLIRDRGGK